MDPKLSTLDPKLREAYDRVMNGPTGAPSATPIPTAPPTPGGATISPPPPIQQVSPPISSPAPSFSTGVQPIIQAEQTIGTAMPTAPAPSISNGSTIAFNANNSQKNQGTTLKHGGKSKIMPIFMGIGIILFLLAYTFVWVFVFKLKIPGLPF